MKDFESIAYQQNLMVIYEQEQQFNMMNDQIYVYFIIIYNKFYNILRPTFRVLTPNEEPIQQRSNSQIKTNKMDQSDCKKHKLPKMYIMVENGKPTELIQLFCQQCVDEIDNQDKKFLNAEVYFFGQEVKRQQMIALSGRNKERIKEMLNQLIFEGEMGNFMLSQNNRIDKIISLLNEYPKTCFNNCIQIQGLIDKLNNINLETKRNMQIQFQEINNKQKQRQHYINELECEENEIIQEFQLQKLVDVKFSCSFITTKEIIHSILQVQEQLFIGYFAKIQLWKPFLNGMFKLEDEFYQHQSNIVNMNYVLNHLITSSSDGVMVIWTKNINSKWVKKWSLQKKQVCFPNSINDHSLYIIENYKIFQIYDVVNLKERTCLHQLTTYLSYHSAWVLGMWEQRQMIEFKRKIVKITFITETQLVIQQADQNYFIFLEKKTEKFLESYIANSDPQIYDLNLKYKLEFIKDKQLLIDYNSTFVSILKINNNNNRYQLVHKVNFLNDHLQIKTPLLIEWNNYLKGFLVIYSEQ